MDILNNYQILTKTIQQIYLKRFFFSAGIVNRA